MLKYTNKAMPETSGNPKKDTSSNCNSQCILVYAMSQMIIYVQTLSMQKNYNEYASIPECRNIKKQK